MNATKKKKILFFFPEPKKEQAASSSASGLTRVYHCDVCDEDLHLTPTEILKHKRQHTYSGKWLNCGLGSTVTSCGWIIVSTVCTWGPSLKCYYYPLVVVWETCSFLLRMSPLMESFYIMTERLECDLKEVFNLLLWVQVRFWWSRTTGGLVLLSPKQLFILPVIPLSIVLSGGSALVRLDLYIYTHIF